MPEWLGAWREHSIRGADNQRKQSKSESESDELDRGRRLVNDLREIDLAEKRKQVIEVEHVERVMAVIGGLLRERSRSMEEVDRTIVEKTLDEIVEQVEAEFPALGDDRTQREAPAA